jgi:hypothetical protein
VSVSGQKRREQDERERERPSPRNGIKPAAAQMGVWGIVMRESPSSRKAAGTGLSGRKT